VKTSLGNREKDTKDGLLGRRAGDIGSRAATTRVAQDRHERTSAPASPRLRAATAAGIFVLLIGALSGCTASTTPASTTSPAGATASTVESESAGAPVSTASPSTFVSQSSGTPTPTSTANSISTRTDPTAPKGQCGDSNLATSVQYNPEGSGAGQRESFVVFRNTGHSTCFLEGTPGLSLVGGGNGTQIGQPAIRTTHGTKNVSVPAGGYALSVVNYTYVDKNGGNYGTGSGTDPKCRAKAADGYRIYAPHSYKAAYSAFKTYACSTSLRWISVGPVMPASSIKGFSPKF
jgi:hypothetical protein